MAKEALKGVEWKVCFRNIASQCEKEADRLSFQYFRIELLKSLNSCTEQNISLFVRTLANISNV
jgi:hypothetical protein